MGEPTHQELLAEFASEYMAQNPGVEITPVFQGLYGALYQKIIASVTAKNPPAMAMMFESWTTRLYDRGRLVPAQEFLKAGDEGLSNALDNFFPAFIDGNRWGDVLVTMPFNKSAHLLQYNVDLLREAGFDEPPESWEELRDAAIAVTALPAREGKSCRGLYVRPQLESFASLYVSGGGQFVDEEFRPKMTSPGAMKTLSFLTELIHEQGAGYVDANYPAIVMGTGTIGMYVYTSASFPYNDRFSEGKFEWRAAPVPPPAGVDPQVRRTLFQGYNVGLLAGNPPEELAAAWDFLQYMLQPEQVARWSMQTGYCPVRRAAVELPEMQAYIKEHPNYRVLLGEVEHAVFEPKPDFWEAWRVHVGDEITNALQGVKSAEAALEAAQRHGEEARIYDSKFPPHVATK